MLCEISYTIICQTNPVLLGGNWNNTVLVEIAFGEGSNFDKWKYKVHLINAFLFLNFYSDSLYTVYNGPHQVNLESRSMSPGKIKLARAGNSNSTWSICSSRNNILINNFPSNLFPCGIANFTPAWNSLVWTTPRIKWKSPLFSLGSKEKSQPNHRVGFITSPIRLDPWRSLRNTLSVNIACFSYISRFYLDSLPIVGKGSSFLH